MTSDELIITPVESATVPMTDHEIYMRTQLHTAEERLIRIEDKLDKIHKVLDIAFTRFEAMSKSPILGTMLGVMTKTKQDG